MPKKDNAKLIKVLSEILMATDMCMGEATGGKPVQDWGLVNRACVNSRKAIIYLQKGGKLDLLEDK